MPEQDPRQLFAERLALLWVEAGKPTYEALAREAQNRAAGDALGGAAGNGRPTRVTKQRISDWRNGKRVPQTFQTLSPVLGVLIPEARKRRPTPVVENLYNGAAWKLWWSDAANAVEPGGRPGVTTAASDEIVTDPPTPDQDSEDASQQICPYRGLAAFAAEHAAFFYGRGRATEALLGKLDEALETGGMIALVGASGSGKSSLLRAGFLPALRKEAASRNSQPWPTVLHTPGEDPCTQLSHHIPELADTIATNSSTDTDDFVARTQEAIRDYAEREGGPGARLLLIVDQAEELFTLCAHDARRDLYMDILAAASTPRSTADPAPAVVLLAVRADFYQRCMDYPDLADALQHRQLLLGPMNTSELREAITGPAHAVGLRLEPGLFELLSRDMGIRVTRGRNRADTTYDAGVLPLLSHALRATWQHRKAGKLAIAGYRSARGIQGAVEATAERAWADLDPAGQAAAMQMLVKLTRLSRDTPDTRRRYDKQRLLAQARDAPATERALETLVAARLVTLDTQTVEITHEALLHAWPRLRQRIEKDRAGLIVRQELEEDAAEWARDRDSALLYRGSRLANARTWGTSDEHRAELSPVATAFLDASIAQRRRSATLRRTAIATLSALSIIASIAAGVAIRQANNAEQARDRAIFTQVVAEADQLRAADPSLAAQLSLTAYRMRVTPELTTDLLATQTSALSTVLESHQGHIRATTISPDARTMAVGGADGTVLLWNLTDQGRPTPWGPSLPAGTRDIRAVAFSPDSRILATGGVDGNVRLWHVADPSRPELIGTPLLASPPDPAKTRPPGRFSGVGALSFSPDGRTLATGGDDKLFRLWNVTDPTRPTLWAPPLPGETRDIRAVAFSPDGRIVATAGGDGTLRLWTAVPSALPAPLGATPAVDRRGLNSLAFSPDGRTVATGGSDKLVRLWNLDNPEHPAPVGALDGNTNAVYGLAFSPDGRLVASAGADTLVRLWDVSEPTDAIPWGRPLAGHKRGVATVAFSPDGRRLVSGGADDQVRLWTLPVSLTGHAGSVNTVIFSSDRRIMVTGGTDGTARLWDTSDMSRPTQLGQPLPIGPRGVTATALSPDGRTLAVGDAAGTLVLWDTSNRDHPTLRAALSSPAKAIYGLAFSPDGQLLASAGADNLVRLWNVDRPIQPVAVFSPDRRNPTAAGPGAIAFSPDGRTLACGAGDYTVRLWDVSTPAQPTLRGATAQHGNFISALAFSPDGATLTSSSADHTLRLWDVAQPDRPLGRGAPLTGHTNPVTTVAYSPDGKILASGGGDGTVRLWDVADPAQSKPIGHEITVSATAVRAVTFSRDGQFLASSGRDRTALLWGPHVDQAIDRICRTTTNILTPAVWAKYVSAERPYQPPCPPGPADTP